MRIDRSALSRRSRVLLSPGIIRLRRREYEILDIRLLDIKPACAFPFSFQASLYTGENNLKFH